MAKQTASQVFTNPGIIDERALESPERPYMLIPRSDNLQCGYRAITYSQLARAVNKVCWWLEENLPPSENYETIVYQGPNDLRHALILYACQKTKRELLVLNPKNSLQSDLKLIDEAECVQVLVAAKHEGLFDTWHQNRPHLMATTFLELEFWLANTKVDPYPYDAPASEEEALSIPWHISHSSGTTGQPKQIPFSVGYQNVVFRQVQAFRNGSIKGEMCFQPAYNEAVLVAFPLTWIAGLSSTTTWALAWEFIPVLLPPETVQPIPPQILMDAIQYSGARHAFVIPFYIQQLLKETKYLEALKSAQLGVLGYAGAGLDEATIKAVQPYVKIVQSCYGSTEFGMMNLLTSPPGYGAYVGLPPHVGCTFEKVPEAEGEEVYELVLKRDDDKEQYLWVFHMRPDISEYRTNDLFVPHPDPASSNFWRHIGRRDDFVKDHFLNKTKGTDIEVMFERVKHIEGACFGEFERADATKVPYFILEIDSAYRAQHKDEEILQMLHPTIEAANKHAIDEIKLTKNNVIIAGVGESLPRLGKGTLNRRAVPEVFKESLARLEKR